MGESNKFTRNVHVSERVNPQRYERVDPYRLILVCSREQSSEASQITCRNAPAFRSRGIVTIEATTLLKGTY